MWEYFVGPAVDLFMNERNNQQNQGNIVQQNALNEQQWLRQTEYNKPINQMSRLKEAGLNPNLAYGQIAESKMAQAPTMQAPRFERPPSLPAYQQVINQQSANELTRTNLALAAEQLKYQKYENKQLMENGVIKSDSQLIKATGRAGDYVRKNIVEPASKAIDNSSLWQSVVESVGKISEAMSKNQSDYDRNRYKRKGGK